MIGYCCRGIGRIRHLEALLEAPCAYVFRRPAAGITHIVGWGLKPTTKKARRVAARNGLPYMQIEDGFLRSHGLGVNGAPLHSLAVDYSGIYYDATRPSDLETLIAEAPFDSAELARARRCMALLRRYRLCKYNHAPDRPVVWPDTRPRVLVVDQTCGDASVTYGCADGARFEEMLTCALREHPQAEVCVKVHPDVIAGKKRGYLLEKARALGCRIFSEDISPWALLDAVEEVYVVTSQLGFEALLAGKKVHCFGLPFYAGWGLTEDRVRCDRRGVRRTLEQLFAAAYLRYCRYINPYTGERCELEDTINLLAEQVRQRKRLNGDWIAAGFSPWKRRFVPGFLGRPKGLRFIAPRKRSLRRAPPSARVLTWASSLRPPFAAACREAGLPLWRMEDGFLRSVGLGADLVRPLSLVLDSRGIYYDAGAPSDLEVILSGTDFDESLLMRARQLRSQLVHLQLSKYNVGGGQVPPLAELAEGRRIILVPGQVETDASIASGSPEIKTNLELLRRVRRDNPDAFIVYKPHPDVVQGARIGALGGDARGLFDLQLTDVAIPVLLEQVDELHTLCSLSGFEALLRGIHVVTYGLPFYAGWGLTEDWLPCPRRKRRLTLDELVAGTLILYPLYTDPVSGDHIDVDTAVRLLARKRQDARQTNLWAGLYRLFRNGFLKK
ncbi:capsular polysaccharide biosynthesis protein [Microbulbifer thermotolerans]|uniref:capsular polysaccharide biosynthesis protein n=1 Tax=Microbulbifer thermotolerans TaxID=252514 RepID=UPI00224AB1FE|nr:capsular polysaccharide biosynthesis protein [Microbulbifer thermotolerans]MCX2781143.1 capsular polysaccharide biosynthesis protein [Microbulbifer thermotolerans]MCX2804604.1 capsular polysaccharide biosynthesis protein [Microbulbifer thermotolerans]MCX2842898.1 capsular polysaccharide biosynthesis protein [Microbulbifer thermotolerans]